MINELVCGSVNLFCLLSKVQDTQNPNRIGHLFGRETSVNAVVARPISHVISLLAIAKQR
jgi:hypothetical protein